MAVLPNNNNCKRHFSVIYKNYYSHNIIDMFTTAHLRAANLWLSLAQNRLVKF